MVAAAVEPTRLLGRLGELARIGADPAGGVTRLAFSAEEREAEELVSGWMETAALTVRYDEFGNMFGATDGGDAAVSLCGSHLDTVPNGGRLDGALGVVAAIEAVEAMRAVGRLPEAALEVVVWRCEEPVRFAQGKAGSLVFSGLMRPDELRPIEQPPLDLAAALAADGDRPRRDGSRRLETCLELHIEQGAQLERAGCTIGVVTAIAAPIRLRVELTGSADHSGATPMADRRDALCGAAELVLAIELAARAEIDAGSVATAAAIGCLPGAMNVVPGESSLLVDVRGVDAASMQRVVADIERAAAEIAERRALRVDVDTLSRGEPTPLSPAVVDRLAEVVDVIGLSSMRMPSGAGHDVQCLAALAEIGMLFVPSVGGISHSPEEHTSDEDVISGARALAACWWALAAGH
jgi:beta-ureidopropionase / N-carbamoyl-L-amino-acid hydrolase